MPWDEHISRPTYVTNRAGRTRLVSRVRARIAPTARGFGLLLVLDPGQFLMERKMLLGIKRRAEKLAA